MVVLDSHVHLIKYTPAEHDWITDEMPGLRRDFLPSDLAVLMADAGVDGCIAVQARQLPVEVEWLLGLAESWPAIVAVVGWVDLCAPDLEAQLDSFASATRLRGFRHVVIDEPADFLDRAAVRAGIEQVGRRGYLYELLVWPDQLTQATDIARRLPNQRFVLDHVGLPDIRAGAHTEWAAGMARLAECANVSVKLSGLDFRARWHDWTDADLRPYLDTAFELFGADRLMMGTNWPVCTLSSTYTDSFGAINRYTASLSPAERSAILGETARRSYFS